jgi:hypothetical protein
MVGALAALRELQAPLLALVLLGACALKLARILRHRAVAAADGATALFPERVRRPATLALCAAELSLGLGLLATAGPGSEHGRGDAVRLTAALFFLVGMCALVELRERRPALGCGCFGELSGKPPGVRSLVRTGLLAVASLAGINARPLHLPPPGPRAVTELGLLLAELLALALASPEVGEVLDRLGYREPCELRVQPPARALTALRRSRSWRRHARMITGGPSDMWRELCWWYVVYPARSGGRDGEVVFAVEVKPRRPAIRAAVVWRAGRRPAEPASRRAREPASGPLPAPLPDQALPRAQVPSATF